MVVSFLCQKEGTLRSLPLLARDGEEGEKERAFNMFLRKEEGGPLAEGGFQGGSFLIIVGGEDQSREEDERAGKNIKMYSLLRLTYLPLGMATLPRRDDLGEERTLYLLRRNSCFFRGPFFLAR